MTKKQKALAQTIFTAIAIITVNQFIDGQKLPKVYDSLRELPVINSSIEFKEQSEEVVEVADGEESLDSSPEQLIRKEFGDKADIALAIAKAESGLNPEAVGDMHITFEKDGKLMGMSCGLFQVRILEGRPDCETLKDPETNVRYAKALYDKSGFQPWSAYTSGKYLENL